MSTDAPPEITDEKMCELVGSFMRKWAFLESRMNMSIEELLSMGSLGGAIVTANLEVRAKIQILRSVVSLYHPGDPQAEKQAKKDIEAIAGLSEDRNIVAHNPFSRTDDLTGVQFMRTTARSSLKFLDYEWSPAQFLEKEVEMGNLFDRLKELTPLIVANRERIARLRKEGSGDYLTRLVQAQIGAGPTTLGTLVENYLYPPPKIEGE